MAEFKEFPKIFRYSREVVVTEKLDGTNAAVIIQDSQFVGAQSRSRLITPQDDNYNFAAWAYTNGNLLAKLLGDGHHYGEWWGEGIQRKYGMKKKMFSLFNVSRWNSPDFLSEAEKINMSCVPTLWTGLLNDLDVEAVMSRLSSTGSVASHGFMRPEGVVIYHTQGNFLLKKTFEKDVEGKSYAA